MDERTNAVEQFRQANSCQESEKYVLQLYVAGSSSRSRQAVVNVQKLCNDIVGKIIDLEIIDILQQPALAKQAQILAVPTLLKKYPNPKRFYIGDLSDTNTIIASLNS